MQLVKPDLGDLPNIRMQSDEAALQGVCNRLKPVVRAQFSVDMVKMIA